MRRLARADILAILILVCIAAFFRFHRLREVPIGLWRDEAANGLEALQVLDGRLSVYYGTREPMFIYLVAVSVALVGRNPLAIRLVSAVVGTATIPATYLLSKEMLRYSGQPARLVAFLTSLWLAISYWHINFSRLGFRGILLPLLASTSFYFLWRGWDDLTSTQQYGCPRRFPRVLWFALAGVCFGLTMYTYTPSRFLPLVLLPFLVYKAASIWRGRKHSFQSDGTLLPHSFTLTALTVFSLSFLVAFAPLGAHFLTDTGSFFARSGVSVFAASQDEPVLVLLGKNALRQLAMFGFAADPNTRHGPAGRPAFDLLTLALFLVGAAVSLRRCRQGPHAFTLIWFSVMLLPAILTSPELPHFLRAIGSLPVAYLFPALGVATLWRWLKRQQISLKARYAFSGIMALCFLNMLILTYHDYFAPTVDEIELTKAFDPRFVQAASIMNQVDDQDSVWIIPLGPNNEQRMAYFVIDFLYHGEAPHRYVRLDEATVAQELSAACEGHSRAMVLNTTEEHLEQPWFDLYADSKGLIPYLFERHSPSLERLDFGKLEVLVYELPRNPIFSVADEFKPL